MEQNVARRPRTAKESLLGVGMAFPAIALLGMFIVWPIITAGFYSTTSASGYGDANPVGFANYIEAVTDPALYAAIWVNVILAAVVVAGAIAIAFCLAYFLFLRVRGWKALQTAYIAPFILPGVVAAMLWQFMLEPEAGLVNTGLRAIGLDALAGPWLTSADTALATVSIIEIWKIVPLAMLLMFSGMLNIPVEVLEAAQIDGAGHFRRMRSVVLPMLRSTIVLVAFLLTVNLFRSFDLVYLLTGGGPLGSTTIATLYVYLEAFENNRYGYANALGIVIGLLLIALAVVQQVTARRLRNAGSKK